VANFITPLIAAIGGTSNFGDLAFTINGSHFRYGLFINALISFVISAAVVYFFVVKPFAALLERYMPKKQAGPTRTCPECLSDIPAAARRCSFCTSEVQPEAVGPPAARSASRADPSGCRPTTTGSSRPTTSATPARATSSSRSTTCRSTPRCAAGSARRRRTASRSRSAG
jgi:large conductance mechanosensitive channel